jgi:uncharacterized protein
MKNFLFASGLVLIMMIAGCANSPPTRFYMLSSTPDIREMTGKTDNGCPTIGVGPIEIPQYLARAQIATSASENEINYAEFDQWAQPLPGNFSHVIAENLSRLACTRAVYQFPWTWPEYPDYRVRVDVLFMAGNPGGKAFLDAWWTVSETKEKKVIVSTRSQYSESIQGQDYGALVQAYSKILASLSRDIAKAIPAH